jgi:hypothetical protein
MSFKQLSEDFPIFLWENFEVINETRKKELMNTVLENKKRNYFGFGGSFKVDRDDNSFFKNLYLKFFKNTISLL